MAGPHVCPVCQALFAGPTSLYKHMQLHQSAKNSIVCCSVKGCDARLSTLESFKTHMSKFHSSKTVYQAPDPKKGLPCPFTTSGCKEYFQAVPQYREHMVCHLKKNEEFTCILDRSGGTKCTSVMRSKGQFSTHVSRVHKDQVLSYVSSSAEETDLPGCFLDVSAGEDHMSCDEGGPDDDSDMEDTEIYPDAAIKDELGRFYLKLEAVHLLPTSTVQDIAEEIQLLSRLCHHKLKKRLVKELEDLKLDKETIDGVVRRTFKEDTIFNTHNKGLDVHQFGTDHLRKNYWKEHFHFISAEKVAVGLTDISKQKYAYQVSIKETLEDVLKDPQVKEAVKESFIKQQDVSNPEDQVLRDFTDGSAFQNHVKCHEGKPCVQLFVFQDAFDPNAFSSSNHKPLGFYFTIGNLPKEVRYKLDLIFLALMVLEKDLKNSEAEELAGRDRLHKCLKPLLDELANLHKNGIVIDGESYPVCVIALIGDALGQHVVGGYVKNFGSCEFCCRFCPMSRTDFKDTPWETRPFRTKAEYDESAAIAKRRWNTVRKHALKDDKKTVNEAENSAKRVASRSSAPAKKAILESAISKTAYKKLTAINHRGIKYRPSPFNRHDLDFHVVDSQPPCIAHDLHEGIVKLVLPQILKHFIQEKKWFTLTTLNKRISGFKYLGSDALDKPKPLKSFNSLSGHAVENWNLLRLLPLLIGDLIEDVEDAYWTMYLILKEITEFVSAPEISTDQVEYLRNLIHLYLRAVKTLLENCLTPKHHHLCHYPDLILMWGPLIWLWTLRYESKHGLFKRIMRSCMNYINVIFTMARKYTCRAAYNRKSNMLPITIEYSSPGPVVLSELPAEVASVLPDDAEQLKTVSIFGTQYNLGDYILYDFTEDSGLQVACIEQIYVRPNMNDILFLLKVKAAELCSSMGYYFIQEQSDKFVLQSYKDLKAYYPLPAYSIGNKQCLVLKHTTPFLS